MADNPYKTLGVKEGANIDDVRKAYRKLAKECHPDKNPGNKPAEEKFKRVSAAFSFLDDDERKAKFDRGEIDADGNPKFAGGFGGRGGFSGDPFGQGGPFAGMGARTRKGGNFDSPDFEDLLGDIFGQATRGQRRQTAAVKGLDVNVNLEIETIDAINGAKKRIKVRNSEVDVSIPAGATTAQVLRLKGKGEKGLGAPDGDLLITLRVKPDSRYRIDANDVYTETKISLQEALGGGKVEIETPSGNVAMKIKPGTNSGQILRLKGKGVAKKGNEGDLMVKILISLPEGDNGELLHLIQNWSRRNELPKGRNNA